MIKLKDFVFLCLGLVFAIVAQRARDFGNTAMWKIVFLTILGAVFLVIAISRPEENSQKEQGVKK